MKKLVIITVGKTHSGKTTFANALEKQLNNSFVMDQDNHAEFINTYYKNLQPKQGPNTLKHSLSKLIVDYAKKTLIFTLLFVTQIEVEKDDCICLKSCLLKVEKLKSFGVKTAMLLYYLN